MQETVIKIEGLRKSFGSKLVLDGVDLTIQRGSSIAIIGRSGTGKSVLIKHVLGLLKPDSGNVWCLGEHINTIGLREIYSVRARVGFVFQFAALFDSLNIRENTGFFLDNHSKIQTEEVDRIVAEKLEQVGLGGTENLMPAELSGGMQKRAGLARALVGDPEIILYDEPTSGLDPITAQAINELINEVKEQTSTTTVIITHDMDSAYKTAEQLAMIHKGKIIFKGTVQETRETENPYVQQFINGLSHGPIDPLHL